MTPQAQKPLAQVQRELAEEILRILAIPRELAGDHFDAIVRAIALYTITIRQ